MRLLNFLRKEASESWNYILGMILLSGIANGALLAVINAGASAASSESSGFKLLLLFIITMGLYVIGKKTALSKSLTRVENMVKNLRLRICEKLRRADLAFIENLGKGDLYSRIAQDANEISYSAFLMANATQEGIMLIFALLYVAWLSKVAFAIIVVSIAIGVYLYLNHRKSMMEDLSTLSLKDAQLLDSLSHLIEGFKEAKLNRKKNNSLFSAFSEVADSSEQLKTSVGLKNVVDIMFSHTFFYTLIAIIVFLLPRVMPTFSEVVLKMTAATLFIIGPLEVIVASTPMFARSDIALKNLSWLEERLDTNLKNQIDVPLEKIPDFTGFQNISMNKLYFSYQDGNGGAPFTMGPVDLQLNRGEILFIVGGNGSGKSTLLKVMTGLYINWTGFFVLDRTNLNPENIPGYRELFAAIFGDFHLFDRLYGLEGVDENKVKDYLKEMELQDKTRFVEGRFTNLNLSAGQRKRLALIVALLEDKEIYVFDEWAADQDMHFREYFYRVILKRLKQQNKTVIAVTHDDRYWNLADRVIKMEYGKIVSDTRPPESTYEAQKGL